MLLVPSQHTACFKQDVILCTPPVWSTFLSSNAVATALFQLSSAKPRTVSFSGRGYIRDWATSLAVGLEVDLRLFLCSALAALFLLLFLLLRLQRGEVDVPDEDALQDEDEEHDDENGEQVRLIVEDGDGLRGGADFTEPIELSHGWSVVVAGLWERCDRNDCICFACSARLRLVLDLGGESERSMNNWTSR